MGTLIIFLLGFAYSFYFYKSSRTSYQLTAGGHRDGNLYYYYIWNSGTFTIDKKDIITENESLNITLADEYTFEFAKVIDQTSHLFYVDLVYAPKEINIAFDFLRPGEGFTIILKKNIEATSYFDFEIKQQRNTIRLPSVIKARGFVSNLNLFNNIFGYSILTFSVFMFFYGNGKIVFSNLNSFLDYFRLITNSIVVFFILYFAPILYKRIKAPRPPKELKLYFIEK